MQQSRPLSVEELAASSPVAGVAEVLALEIRRDPQTGAIYTDARLRMIETWSSNCPAEPVLTQVGGELQGRRSALPDGSWTLRPGETVVVFGKPWKGAYVAATGRHQGLGHVDAQGRVTWEAEPGLPPGFPIALDALRSRVGRVLGRELAAPEAPAPAPHPAAPAAVPATRPAEALPPSGDRRDAGGGSLPFFVLAALLFLAALALRLRRRQRED